ncbi:hypothetical protein O7626_14515 [Micromonospora sp. WMMD1102]|uniref:MAB_1171c family putative transporter n=1 Tax=Micromonospora sp. WMMD1102 TaxID=3016105 RepID=UPI0024152E55|nr:MAB_1171c family putative transporter [Micromonospora sp. WMMD1102]MDG4787128.1 hypothetical protein [Micromonospora sp. WMMD1102]
MFSSIAFALIGAAGLYVTYGLATRPASRTPARAWMAAALLLAFTGIVAWWLYDPITDLTAVPNLARLLFHLIAGIASTGAAMCMLRHWVYPPDTARRAVRRQQWISGTLAMIMVIAFFTSVADTEHEPGPWQDRYGHLPLVIVYIITFNTALGWLLFELGRLSWRYAQQIQGRRRTRVSLRLFALAGWIGMVYVVTQIANVAATAIDKPLPQTIYHTTVLISQNVCVVLIAAAAVIPGIGAATTRSRRAIAAARLEPLWQAFRKVFPYLLKPPPKNLIDAIWTGLRATDDYPLHRMIIEIRDGYLELRPWYDEEVSAISRHLADQAGLRGRKAAAVVEAATVLAALQAKAAGRQPAGTGQVEVGAEDMKGEARWLSQVARACAKSTVVRQVLDGLNQPSWVETQLQALGISRTGIAS